MKNTQKNILVISYWSLREPLTAAAVFPYLRLLSARKDIKKIHLVTLETTRDFLPEVDLNIEKVEHHAINPRLQWWFKLSRIYLHIRAVLLMTHLIKKEKIDLMFAKASMAGAIAHIVHRLTGTPYIVDSFEPHSIYMLECGVWRSSDIRFKFANHFEGSQLKHAQYVITVTHNHRNDLIAEGSDPNRIKVIPSITDLAVFKPDCSAREQIRRQLGIPFNSTVGIYVGKFGGLYYEEEAYRIFGRAFEHFSDLHMIILSPADPTTIRSMALQAGLPGDRLHVMMVPHVEVPDCLSAADFAFSTIKPSPIKRYQCPIKNGEYWANGLPILMTDGISDDYLLMRKGLGGSVFQPDMSDLDSALVQIKHILARPEHKKEIIELALQYKSVELAAKVYDEILGPSGS